MASTRTSRHDDLGLRRALSDRLLPLLVASMVFLAALSIAGMQAASSLAEHWQTGAASEITVQLPTRDRVDFSHIPGIARAERLDDARLAGLLRPWLGADPASLSLPLPSVVDVHLAPGANTADILHAISRAAPQAVVEQNGAWLERLAALGHSLQACAALALALVTLIALALVIIATRAGLAARRDAIEIVHALGATDAMIAWRFAKRVAFLTGIGGAIGAFCAVPVLLALAELAAPFSASQVILSDAVSVARSLPIPVWACLPSLPIATALIGFATATATVRFWLARLP